MNAITPHLADQEKLAPLASRYVDVESLPWKPSPYEGVEFKVLMDDPDTGMQTSLVRFAPGSNLPLHEHVEFEQTWILEGRLVDNEGEATAGNFVWRPGGSVHVAHAPDGCLLLAFLLKPNKFLEAKDA
jgi:anti-sigma factor ChrR (cupin superfamily)